MKLTAKNNGKHVLDQEVRSLLKNQCLHSGGWGMKFYNKSLNTLNVN